MMRVLLFSTVLVSFAACSSPAEPDQETATPVETETSAPAEPARDAPDYAPIPIEGEQATEEERARCEAAGGIIQRAGLLGHEHCIQTLPDAGNACRDTDECHGRCIIVGDSVEPGAETKGQCSATDNPFGCFQEVADGKAHPPLCVD